MLQVKSSISFLSSFKTGIKIDKMLSFEVIREYRLQNLGHLEFKRCSDSGQQELSLFLFQIFYSRPEILRPTINLQCPGSVFAPNCKVLVVAMLQFIEVEPCSF